jgi:transposase
MRLLFHATANHEQRLKPYTEIAAELGIKACAKTIHKVFEQEHYYRRVATEKPWLTAFHMQNWLFWSNLAVSWPQEIWNRIIWSDEATFRLGHEKLYVTRRPEERYLPACCVPKFKDFVSLFVWGCIGGDGSKGPLLIWDREILGNWDSSSYCQHVWPYIESFRQEHEIFRVGIGNSVFMQDGSSVHTAKATERFLYERAVHLLWWPSNSPDLNPIENVWRLLESRVRKRYLKIKEELRQCIEEEWARITPQEIRKYTQNMNERCRAVISAQGGHTPY